MKLKNKSILLITLISLLQSNVSFSQSGFIGKKNEVSLDIVNIPFGNINGSYKYSYAKRKSLIIDLGYLSKKSDASSILNNSINNVYGTKFNGLMFGVGLLWNSSYASMNMPIGYYTGFSIDLVRGKLTNTIPKNQLSENIEWSEMNSFGYVSGGSSSNYKNKNDLEYTFKTSGYHFNFYYGKNTYLTKNLTLDFCLKFGFAYYRYKPSNFTPYPIYTNNSNVVEPKHVGIPNNGGYTIYDKSENVYYSKERGFNLEPTLYPSVFRGVLNSDIIDGSSSSFNYNNYGHLEQAKTLTKLKFLLLPQIKIGYLF